MKRGKNKKILTFVLFLSLVFIVSLSTSLNITSPEGNNITLEYKSEPLNIDFNVSNETNISWNIENSTSSDNFSINTSTGVLKNDTALEIGNYSININATNKTSGNSTLKNFTVFVEDSIAPNLTLPNENSFYDNQSISLNFNATDASNLSKWQINGSNETGNFSINTSTGLVKNTSSLAIKNHSLNISVNDTLGNTKSTIFDLEIKNSTEDNGSDSDNSTDDSTEETCDPDWNCTEWECEDGTKTRTCEDENNCDNETDKPSETQSCSEECNPDEWKEWEDKSDCENGTKIKTRENDCENETQEKTVNCTPENNNSEDTENDCEVNESCGNWSKCMNETKSRECIDLNNCSEKYPQTQITDCKPENRNSSGGLSTGWIIGLGLGGAGILAIALYSRNKKIKIKNLKKLFRSK